MDHILAASFFTFLFLGAGAGLQALVGQYRAEIVAALRGEHRLQPTIYRARITRPAAAPQAGPMRRAAA